MRAPRFRIGWLMVASTLVLAFGVVVCFVRPWEKVTQRNFDKIQIGMSQSEIRALLGAPPYEKFESGLVERPDSFTTNRDQSEEQARLRGFHQYRFQQWHSPEITIVAISDLDDRVVSRYTGPGQSGNWIAFALYWLTRWF